MTNDFTGIKRLRILSKLVVTFVFLYVSGSAFGGGGCSVFTACPSPEAIKQTELSEPYTIVDGWIVIDGDIAIARVKDWDNNSTVRGLVITVNDRLWPGGVINYVIDADMPQNLVNNIKNAIADVETDTPITFQQSAVGNFIRFRLNSDLMAGVCSSALGMIGGEQFITLVPNCSRGTIIHEIGHALGMHHEQKRIDRDEFITVNLDNACPTYHSQFATLSQEVEAIGPYDYGSIMHYGRCAFSINGLETITAPAVIGQRNRFSQNDINTITTLYQDNSDDDEDGIAAFLDNCSQVYNPLQTDSDLDGFGNACDADYNNDNIVNAFDLVAFRSAYLTVPGDSNWHTNIDLTGDNIVNAFDLVRIRDLYLLPPGPSNYSVEDAFCPTTGGFVCEWSPGLNIVDFDIQSGIVNLVALGTQGVDRHLAAAQWQLNDGPWKSDNMTIDSFNGTASFCAPGPGRYEFRPLGRGELSIGKGDFPCFTCGAETVSVVIPGPVQPTCSADLPQPPAAPLTPVVTQLLDSGMGSVAMAWNPVSATAAQLSYEIQYSNASSGGTNIVIFATETSASIEVECSGFWDFSIRACSANASGIACSSYSAMQSVLVADSTLPSCSSIGSTGPISAPMFVFSGDNYDVNCEPIAGSGFGLTYKIFESIQDTGEVPGPGPVEFSSNCMSEFNNFVSSNTQFYYWSQACETGNLSNCGPFTGPRLVLVLDDK